MITLGRPATRFSAQRRKIVVILSIVALLISQWTMAFHHCLPGELAASAGEASESVQLKCHESGHESPTTEQVPESDVVCTLHCAQPDEASAPNKGAVPGAMLSGDLPLLFGARLQVQRPVVFVSQAPPRDARRRLIEHGALLI